MPIRYLVVAALLAATGAQAADLGRTWEDPPRIGVETSLRFTADEPPPTRLLVGDEAPSFSYLDTEGAWQRSLDLTENHPVLLVFGASEEWLADLGNTRGMFEDLGVVPVIVTDRRAGSARSMATRMGLSAPIVTDPRLAIGDLFNTLNPLTHRHSPSFFVIDERRTIRALQRGPLPNSFQVLLASARGLGLALPESAWSRVTG